VTIVENAAPKKATVASLATQFLRRIRATTEPHTTAEYKRLIEKNILPGLGRKHVKTITAIDIAQLLESQCHDQYDSRATLALLLRMFNLAQKLKMRSKGSNPCRHIRNLKTKEAKHFWSAEELVRLGNTLATYDKSPYVIAAIRFAVFTGAPIKEVLSIRWNWIDFEQKVIRCADSMSSTAMLYLTSPALAILSQLKRIDGNPYVFPGPAPGITLKDLERPWCEIRTMAGWDDITLNDLRGAGINVSNIYASPLCNVAGY